MFSYDQALIQARKLARGEADADTEAAATGFAPINLDGALTAYAADGLRIDSREKPGLPPTAFYRVC